MIGLVWIRFFIRRKFYNSSLMSSYSLLISETRTGHAFFAFFQLMLSLGIAQIGVVSSQCLGFPKFQKLPENFKGLNGINLAVKMMQMCMIFRTKFDGITIRIEIKLQNNETQLGHVNLYFNTAKAKPKHPQSPQALSIITKRVQDEKKNVKTFISTKKKGNGIGTF